MAEGLVYCVILLHAIAEAAPEHYSKADYD
jgi:hypothetical protein